MQGEPQATIEPLGRRLPSADARPVSARRQVINIGDRVFYIITRSLGLFVIVLAVLLVGNLVDGAWEAIRRRRMYHATTKLAH